MYWLYSYHAGAAHPNQGVATFCFLVDPLCQISTLTSIFTDADAALSIIQNEVRSALLANKMEDNDDYALDPEWVARGTEDWNAFEAFVFDENGIEFHFPPYQVASYAHGPQIALVKYSKLNTLMTTVFKSALDVEYLAADE